MQARWVLAMTLLAAACRAPAPRVASDGDIDDVSRDCKTHLADGSLRVERTTRIGFREKRDPAGTPVVIYGASWCRACDLVKQYLDRRGIPYVEKDVEESADAAKEALADLEAAGLRSKDVLPIVDVRGTVTQGFAPCVVEQAWAAP